ncbi:MATE family efflux transporter [Kitasatospora viridis]|uniref:Probable multidrug resistance protein NorM n=1 Tax=Kitasatospora viridis TaxID=281105 RepID=A0A561ULN9_9ACTN|nr:MATE family efflux transporter [Kitasatospora viridis]TWG00293.1 putative MATE family efflux protein [Kitasatospora viridis]
MSVTPVSTPSSPAAVRRALLGLGVPVYLELLSGVIAGIIDTAWGARLGASAVGAIAVASTVENVLLGVILAVNVGATVLIADALASGRRAAVPVITRAAGLLWLAITPVVAVGGFLAHGEVARLLAGGDTEVVRLAAEFFAVSFPGMAVFFAQNVVDGLFKGTGDTRTPMRMAMVANAVILVADPVLMYGVGGAPRLGVAGAAVGMLLGRTIALAASLVLLRGRRVGEHGGGPRLGEVLRKLLGIGLPVSGDFVLRMGMAAALVGVVARFGEAPLAAYGIGTKLILFVTMACYSFRQAGSILTARGCGPQLVGRQSALLAMGLAAGAGTVLALFGRSAARVFSSAPDVVGVTGEMLWYLVPYLVLLAGVISLGGVFMGSGRSRSLLWATAFGAAVQLPLAYGLSAVAGVRGVWLSMVLGAAAQLAVVLILFLRLGRGGKRIGRRSGELRGAAGQAGVDGMGDAGPRDAEPVQAGQRLGGRRVHGNSEVTKDLISRTR